MFSAGGGISKLKWQMRLASLLFKFLFPNIRLLIDPVIIDEFPNVQDQAFDCYYKMLNLRTNILNVHCCCILFAQNNVAVMI